MSKQKQIADVRKTIYNEARGEGQQGMRVVCDTINNRINADLKYLGGKDPSSVCSKGYDGFKGKDPNPTHPGDIRAYDYSNKLATDLVNGQHQSQIQSTHFDASRTSFQKMEDKGGLRYDQKIGNHYFFTQTNAIKHSSSKSESTHQPRNQPTNMRPTQPAYRSANESSGSSENSNCSLW